MPTKISKPPKTERKRTDKLPDPPQSQEKVSKNLSKKSSSETDKFTFVTDVEFKKEYKIFAAEHNMTMTEVLKRSFELYKKSIQ